MTEFIFPFGRQFTGESDAKTRCTVAKVPPAGMGMSLFEQAEQVRHGSASCRGVMVVDSIPSLLHVEPLGRGVRVRQPRRSGCAKIRTTNEAFTALNLLAVFVGQPGQPVNQVQKEVRARCLARASRWRPGEDAPCLAGAALSVLFRGMSLYGDESQQHTCAFQCRFCVGARGSGRCASALGCISSRKFVREGVEQQHIVDARSVNARMRRLSQWFTFAV